MKKTAFIVILLAFTFYAFSQENTSDSLRKDALKLFIDCEYCDLDFIRKEITWVNYVRDFKEAQVHLLVSTQNTGSGGNEYTFTFYGKNEFAGLDDTITVTTQSDATSDEIRETLTAYLKLGLTRYAAKTPLAKFITIDFQNEAEAGEVDDPWNSWVFNIDASGNLSGQESYTSEYYYGSLSANRITEDYKYEADVSTYYSEQTYDISDNLSYFSSSKSNSASFLMVKSLTDHWSVGGDANVYSSTYSNAELIYGISPTIEYNLFKYSESTRKQLMFRYSVGFSQNYYNDTTIFNKIEETLFSHNLGVATEFKQKWGSFSSSVSYSQYLHDLSLNSLSLYESLDIRIIKGLSFRTYFSVSFLHNQISLPKQNATPEEILLQKRQLSTGYSYYGSIGFSYTFGSIYNNVVNPRFGD